MTVTDASPLIALDRVGRLGLVPAVLGAVAAPPAVIREFGHRPDWLEERAPVNLPLVRALRGQLDEGEAEALALAVDLGARAVLLDEKKGRRVATDLGVPVLGTAGLLLRAKRAGELPAVRPVLDALADDGFRLAPSLYEGVVERAGE